MGVLGERQAHVSIAEDRMSFEVRLAMEYAAPLGEWALIIGDSVHDIRAALDVHVWSICDTESSTIKIGARSAGHWWPTHRSGMQRRRPN